MSASWCEFDDAKIAKEAMCDQNIRGRRVRIDFSITKKPHARTPGFYNGKPNTVKEKIISSKKSLHDLENDAIEQKTTTNPENQDSYQDWIKINNCLCVFGLCNFLYNRKGIKRGVLQVWIRRKSTLSSAFLDQMFKGICIYLLQVG